MYSFLLPSATVTLGFVAVPVIVGILYAWARSETGIVVFDVTEPTIAFTRRWLIRRFATLAASVGSFLSSSTTGMIFIPATPPAALASETAISKAFRTDSPKVFTSPESGVMSPILIPSGFAHPENASAANAATRNAAARFNRSPLSRAQGPGSEMDRLRPHFIPRKDGRHAFFYLNISAKNAFIASH